MPKHWNGLLHEGIRSGNKEVIRTAIYYGANINSVIHDRNTALATATQCGRIDIMQHLITLKADVFKTGSKGKSPISWAIYRDHLEALKLLLATKINVNSTDAKGNTPLVYASQEGRTKILEYLLNNGADPNKATSDGKFPLIEAAISGHLPVVKLLVAKGADINKMSSDGNTAVALATKYKNSEIVKFLVMMEANICKFGKKGKPPLSWAVINEDLDVVEFLLENGAGNSIRIALVDAEECGSSEMIKILVEEGVDIDNLGEVAAKSVGSRERNKSSEGYSSDGSFVKVDLTENW